MPMQTVIVSPNVDAENNIKISLPIDPDYMGGARIFSENDPGAVTGSPFLRSPETSYDTRLRVGRDTLLMNDQFNALTQNTNNWYYESSTLTAAQPGLGTVNFSEVQGTTLAHGAFMRTYQYFPLIGTSSIAVELSAGQFNSALVANENWLMGLGLPGTPTTAGSFGVGQIYTIVTVGTTDFTLIGAASNTVGVVFTATGVGLGDGTAASTTTPPTDGVWFRLTSAGLVGVVSYNGTQSVTGILVSLANTTVGSLDKYVIVVGEQSIQYWKNDILLVNQESPAAFGQPFQQGSLPAFMMKYNTGTVSNTNTMRVMDFTVSLMDLATTKPWAEQAATAGMAGYVGQNGQTQGQTAIWPNSTAPTPQALSNTGTTPVPNLGLGGIAAINPTLATNNDGILFSYLNPIPTVNRTGRNLLICGVKVQSAITADITVGGPMIFEYAIAHGHTAISLATVQSGSFTTNTVTAPKRVPIGAERYITTFTAGQLGAGATAKFQIPLVVRPGQYVQLIVRNVGTASSAGVVTFCAMFDSYWE